MPTVLVTDYDFPDLDIETDVLAEFELVGGSADSPEAVVEAAREADADALLVQYAPITAEVFEALPDLEVVARYGIGVDNVDLEAATEHGVPVVNVPSYCEEEVSTHALALLLSCVRRTALYTDQIHSGGWDWTAGQPIHRIRGGTLGLVGFGKIPPYLVGKVAGFDLECLAYDPYKSAEEIADGGAEKVGFEELLERSDFVSVHTPLTDETRGMFDADAFAAMKDSAILVNTARGPVVDVDALATAIEAGDLAAAGVDVMPDEPPESNPLADVDEVVLTPHVAWHSEESILDLRRNAAEDVRGVLSGEPPRNPVNDD
jgi:D-3-phosphoglycerate dehydrogenase